MDDLERVLREAAREGGGLEKAINARRDLCQCPTCPTYIEKAKKKDERVYCLGGKSKCIKEDDMQGCVCSDCPVQAELGQDHMYYCVYGSAREQGGK